MVSCKLFHIMSRHTRGIPQSESIRARLWEDQHGECFWCMEPCVNMAADLRWAAMAMHSDLALLRPRMFTLDHLVPRSRGGSNDEGNLVGACSRCNGLRAGVEQVLKLHGMKVLLAWKRWSVVPRWRRELYMPMDSVEAVLVRGEERTWVSERAFRR